MRILQLLLRLDDRVLRKSIAQAFLGLIHPDRILDNFGHSLERHLLYLQHPILELG